MHLPDWEGLDFCFTQANSPEEAKKVFDGFVRIYRDFLVPAFPWAFGQMILFSLPYKDTDPVDLDDDLRKVAGMFQENVKLHRRAARFEDGRTEKLYKLLQEDGLISIVRGKLPYTKIIPVNNRIGFLTGKKTDDVSSSQALVNASFFIMDPFDCGTLFDIVGTPLGLCVKDGAVLNPPLYGRECLLVKKDGSVSIEIMELKNLKIRISGSVFKDGENIQIFTRPARKKTPRFDGWEALIINRRIAGVQYGGALEIPSSGYVIRFTDPDMFEKPAGKAAKAVRFGRGRKDKKTRKAEQFTAALSGTAKAASFTISPGMSVDYEGLEDVIFGIQAGNSLVRDGKVTEGFISPFYNIYKLKRVPYPPSLYHPDYEHARAARIGLGAGQDGKPMIIFAEGAPKTGDAAMTDSSGASLLEFARICKEQGMENGVNLDGGGSAQILIDGERSLKIADRKEDGTECERAVPVGLSWSSSVKTGI